jgi:hypothetical protein
MQLRPCYNPHTPPQSVSQLVNSTKSITLSVENGQAHRRGQEADLVLNRLCAICDRGIDISSRFSVYCMCSEN